MARATTPPTALHVIAKTGTEAGARITAAEGTGLGPSVELLVLDVSSPAAVRVSERARTAREVQPFRRGASALASTCITLAAFKFPPAATAAAARGSATGSECENERGEVDPTIACGGAGKGVGGKERSKEETTTGGSSVYL